MADHEPQFAEPSEFHRKFMEASYVAVRGGCWLFGHKFQHITSSGKENFPNEGPVLVLSNHSCYLDPFTVIVGQGRPISWMATPTLAKDTAFLGFICWWWGVIPKKKYVTDVGAIRRMKKWAEHDHAVGLFPEGNRCWDGHTAEVLPGIEKLVRLVDAPVVTARVYNGMHQWPRWCHKARYGRVHVEYDKPVTFDKKTPLKDIRKRIVDGINVDFDNSPKWPVRGTKLARGISNVIWSCPECGGIQTVAETDDDAHCTRCGARWKVETDLVLYAKRKPAHDIRIDHAMHQARDQLRARGMVPDPERFERDGVLLESEPMKLMDCGVHPHAQVAEGIMVLNREALEIRDPDGRTNYRVELKDMRIVALDLIRNLQFRTDDGRFLEALVPESSMVLWEQVLQHWSALARGEKSRHVPATEAAL